MTEKVASRRERAKADKMRRILAAGAKLFSQKGFDGTTVQEIADEADIAVGTLFLYVSDKSEILLLLFHNSIEQQFKKAVRSLNSRKKFIPAVKRFLTDLIAPHEQNQELSRAFWREFLFHKGKVRMQLDTLSGAIIGVLQAKIRTAKLAGEIDKGVDESVAALQIYGIYHSTLAFYLAECLPATSPEQTIDALLQSLWHGMIPRP